MSSPESPARVAQPFVYCRYCDSAIRTTPMTVTGDDGQPMMFHPADDATCYADFRSARP